jgi:hypothetical protein
MFTKKKLLLIASGGGCFDTRHDSSINHGGAYEAKKTLLCGTGFLPSEQIFDSRHASTKIWKKMNKRNRGKTVKKRFRRNPHRTTKAMHSEQLSSN